LKYQTRLHTPKAGAKKKRHAGIPDPANQLCVEDIDLLLNDVARENQLLVNCHFNILVAAPVNAIQKAVNFIESSLFQLGIIPSKNAYNQLELFRTALPGNGVELKEYDWFLTTCDAALCFFFKESLPRDEPSDFLIRFTDRQGIPVGIDPADLPMRTGRINNRNKFVLGPSGSGKSFFMNALIEQYMLYNMDVVIVDTGHSYSGLCSYYQGKYITYTDQSPITMNPFRIEESEYNIEKKDFLCTLIGVAWKGADGFYSPVERDVVANVISAYYSISFAENGELTFNTFYEFALEKIPEIKTEEKILFDFDEFRYVLKKFYKGGEFATILNKDADKSLFTERFIVYEIDSVKEHKILFPLVTLTIMDVFLQKMRYRSDKRKALVVEEAWKAIASPLMAGYLLYLYKTVRKFWGEAIVVTQELGTSSVMQW
jgi:conjugation system TraG family ATPase